MIIGTKKKQKANKTITTKTVPARIECGRDQARDNGSPGKAERGNCVGKALQKNTEIVQYHPPRGKP